MSDKWVSTWGGGVARIAGQSFLMNNTDNSGIPSNLTTCAAVDIYNEAWFGTMNGIGVFDKYTGEISTLEIPASQNGITVYPNPVNTNARIMTEGLAPGNYSVMIYSLDGKKEIHNNSKLHVPADNKYDIDCSGLSPGIYIIQISNNSTTHTAYMIKQ